MGLFRKKKKMCCKCREENYNVLLKSCTYTGYYYICAKCLKYKILKQQQALKKYKKERDKAIGLPT